MTEPDIPSPAWQADSDTLWYAIRGLAEHELITNLAHHGFRMSEEQADFARLAITTTAVAAMKVLHTAGWLRDEPSVAFEDTPLDTIAKVTKARLAAQENPGMS